MRNRLAAQSEAFHFFVYASLQILSSLAAFLALGACVRDSSSHINDPNEETAFAAVDRFHEALHDGRYEEICRKAEQGAFASITALSCPNFLAFMHDRLGNVVEARRKQLPIQEISSGQIVRVALEYTTRFDRGDAEEHFELRVTGPDILLTSYKIDSAALSH